MSRLLLSLCLVAWVLPAHAGLFDDDEARKRIEGLRSDLTALQQKADIASKNQLDFANQIEAIRADIAALRGQIEVLTYELDATQKRQKDFYVDLDNRLRKLEPGGNAPAATGADNADPSQGQTPAPGASAPVDEAAAARDYEAALNLIKAAKYKDAVSAFTNFTKNYAGSQRLPSAYFWLASSHYQLREFGKAADYFGKVASTWPNDPKAPDALLGQANAQYEAGDGKGGRKMLELLVQKYPKSTAAQSAQQRLKKK